MSVKNLSLILVIVVASFIGFCIENTFIGFMRGFVDNRNMVLPFLFGYGLALFLIYVLFGTPRAPEFFTKQLNINNEWIKVLYYFFITFLCVSVGEIILGHLTEWCCGIVWWNYSALPLHITKYTSVPTSMGFAFLITLFMRYCFDPLINIFSKIDPFALSVISISFVILLSLDMINSASYMLRNHSTLNLWRYEFKKPLRELFSRTFHSF